LDFIPLLGNNFDSLLLVYRSNLIDSPKPFRPTKNRCHPERSEGSQHSAQPQLSSPAFSIESNRLNQRLIPAPSIAVPAMDRPFSAIQLNLLFDPAGVTELMQWRYRAEWLRLAPLLL
jgi:hypothetical protein